MPEDDACRVAAAMATDLANCPEPDLSPENRASAVKVIDCVLSLRKNYKTTVLPRVKEFERQHPYVRTCADLRQMIASAESPHAFLQSALRMDSPGKSAALVGVVNYLIQIQNRFAGGDEETRLHEWANWARPGDYLSMEAPGFALAGFQYLRMLFGADTAKPDVHIIRYVSDVLKRPVSDVQALYILERAAEIAGKSLRRLDAMIWERGAKW